MSLSRFNILPLMAYEIQQGLVITKASPTTWPRDRPTAQPDTNTWVTTIPAQRKSYICPKYCFANLFIYLFGVLRRFQHCTGHIMTGSWKGRGNQYIEFARVVYCKLPTNGKQLPAFPLKAVTEIEPRPQRWEARVLPLCHRGPLLFCKMSNSIDNSQMVITCQLSIIQ